MPISTEVAASSSVDSGAAVLEAAAALKMSAALEATTVSDEMEVPKARNELVGDALVADAFGAIGVIAVVDVPERSLDVMEGDDVEDAVVSCETPGVLEVVGMACAVPVSVPWTSLVGRLTTVCQTPLQNGVLVCAGGTHTISHCISKLDLTTHTRNIDGPSRVSAGK
jgi:hypothetical protein